MNKYSDIINLSRPISNHPKMPIENRAKEFMPFAALTGYNESIIEEGRLVDTKKVLSKDRIDEINNILNNIDKDNIYQITYFKHDKYKGGGEYLDIIGKIKKIDFIYKKITLDNKQAIEIKDIYNIEQKCPKMTNIS